MKAKSQAKSKGEPANRRKSGQFVKGVSGNPSGRPKGQADGAKQLGEQIRSFLALPAARTPQWTNLETLISRLYEEDPKTLLAYGFGKPIETHDVNIETVAGLPNEVLVNLRKLAEATAEKKT